MLVYLREDMRSQVLAPPTLDDIPPTLKEIFDKENEMLDEMQRELDVHNECGVVYLISPEIIQSQFEIVNDTVQFPHSLPTNDSFKGNPNQRVKIKMKMESKLGDLVTKIRDYTGVGDQRVIYLYRINSRGFRS